MKAQDILVKVNIGVVGGGTNQVLLKSRAFVYFQEASISHATAGMHLENKTYSPHSHLLPNS